MGTNTGTVNNNNGDTFNNEGSVWGAAGYNVPGKQMYNLWGANGYVKFDPGPSRSTTRLKSSSVPTHPAMLSV